MPILAPVSALSAHASQIAAQSEASTTFQLCGGIFEAADRVRVNKGIALALSKRINGTVEAISSALEQLQELPQPGNAGIEPLALGLGGFETILVEVHQSLLALGKQSYLSQLLHQQRDRSHIDSLSEKVDSAFNILMMKLRIRMSAAATQLDGVITKHQKHMQELSELVFEPMITAKLPPRPQIHFGRTAELEAVAATVTAADSVAGRVAILGGPGMGKTTLAVAVLHHPAVERTFGRNRYFVPCDAADGLVCSFRLLAEALGMAASDRDTAKDSLLRVFRGKQSLLVLDNFESAWDASEQREDAEQFLRFLNSLATLSLIVTMRGAEKPYGASWSRPFLPPLSPLSDDAARQTFLSVSGIADAEPESDALLHHLGNVPLAIILMANLAQYEPLDLLLKRWEELETAMLVRSGGKTRHTSLDVSISLSLQSPRMQNCQGALRLLSILSILPYGCVDTDLLLWGIAGTTHALSVLLGTALATRTAQRIHVLAPIRSYITTHHPPEETALVPIYDHFFGIADVAAESALAGVLHEPETFAAVVPELANIESIVRHIFKLCAVVPGCNAEAALRAAECLCEVQRMTGIGPGIEILPLALKLARTEKLEKLEAAFLSHKARLTYQGGLPGDPRSLYEESRDIYARIGDEERAMKQEIVLLVFLAPDEALAQSRRLYAQAERLQHLECMTQSCLRAGFALHIQGRTLEAIAQHELAIALILRAADPTKFNRLTALHKYHIAECHRAANDFTPAVTAYHDALLLFKKQHDAFGECGVYAMLAHIALRQGRLRDAIEHASSSLTVQHMKCFRPLVSSLWVLVESEILIGDYSAAAADLERLHAFEPAGGFWLLEQSQILGLRGRLALHCDDLPEARALLSAARQVARSPCPINLRPVMQEMETIETVHLCELECTAGRTAEAVILGVYAAVAFRARADAPYTAEVLVLLAEAMDDELAEQLVGAVMLPLLRFEKRGELAATFMRSATIAEHRGDHALAAQRARAALRYFGEIKIERHLRIARRILSR